MLSSNQLPTINEMSRKESLQIAMQRQISGVVSGVASIGKVENYINSMMGESN